MTALSRRKISAWACAIILATIWGFSAGSGGAEDRWIIGIVSSSALLITLLKAERPLPVGITLGISVIVFSILIVNAVFRRSTGELFIACAQSVIFLSAQWIYLKSFPISSVEPGPIDPSQNPGERL